VTAEEELLITEENCALVNINMDSTCSHRS